MMDAKYAKVDSIEIAPFFFSTEWSNKALTIETTNPTTDLHFCNKEYRQHR
jgi:hypothetical protein